jgi:hypothetical protein
MVGSLNLDAGKGLVIDAHYNRSHSIASHANAMHQPLQSCMWRNACSTLMILTGIADAVHDATAEVCQMCDFCRDQPRSHALVHAI